MDVHDQTESVFTIHRNTHCHLLIARNPLGIGQDTIHRRYADPGASSDLVALQAFGIEPDHLGRPGALGQRVDEQLAS